MQAEQVTVLDVGGSSKVNVKCTTTSRDVQSSKVSARVRRSKAGRSGSATEWTLELVLTEVSSTQTRGLVYAALQGECTSLLVCVEESERLTVSMGVTFSNGALPAPDSVARLLDCHTCARFKSQLTNEEVLALAKRVLPSTVDVKSADLICDWNTTIQQVSKTDLDAALKDIDVRTLDWQSRMWLKIVYDGVRSVHSSDPIFRVLAAKHAAVASTFQRLLNRYHHLKNLTNPRRVIYADCTDPRLIDAEIVSDVVWARKVLDWFAERLAPPDLGRRSLYLWGAAGVGKTRFIERLLEAQMCLTKDCAESFFLQGLSEDHQFVWLDEFVPDIIVKNKEYRQQFNKLTGRERVMVRVKGADQYEVDADTIRTVVTSNHPPLTDDYFRRRFIAVKANEPIYGARAAPKLKRGRAEPQPEKAVGIPCDQQEIRDGREIVIASEPSVKLCKHYIDDNSA